MLTPCENFNEDEDKSNMQVSSRGLDAHIKVSLMPKEAVKVTPMLSTIVRQKPKEKRMK